MISCIAKWSMLAAIVFTKRIDVNEIYDRALAAYYKVCTIKDTLHIWKIFDTNVQFVRFKGQEDSRLLITISLISFGKWASEFF